MAHGILTEALAVATSPYDDGGPVQLSEQKVAAAFHSTGEVHQKLLLLLVIIARRVGQQARTRSHPRDRVGLPALGLGGGSSFSVAALRNACARLLTTSQSQSPSKPRLFHPVKFVLLQ
jgi:hypothetical protein